MKNNEVINIESDIIITIIENARINAYRKVNEELINMYWKIGEYLSNESKKASFGDSYMISLSNIIQTKFPGIKGFTKSALYRMRQFYNTYKDCELFPTMLRKVSWSNHVEILSSCKSLEEKHFYISLCIKENYTTRELRRQIKSSYYQRYMLSSDSVTPKPIKGLKGNSFLDIYVLDFLNLPINYKERDLKKGLIKNMKKFILEIGKDFSFIGEEYRIEVGMEDFYIDLLFYHRELKCLVAFELKTERFKPEYISKMDFYLEALDRQNKKEHENPSVGIILCASKDDEVVKYALCRTLSPLMVAEYELKLPKKEVLEKKLQEFIRLNE